MADALQLDKQNVYSNVNTRPAYKTTICLIIIAGIAFRLYHYFYNRSLWEDEIYLSTGIEHYTLSQLFTSQLDFQQKAPIGYLVIVKLITMLLGGKEMELRLFPMLCGIASLFCFVSVAKHFLKPAGVLVALALVAFAPTLVYHAVEAKQYAVEFLATIIILQLYVKYYNRTDTRSLLAWGLWGAVIVWFSYSSVFILAGVAATVGLRAIIHKHWSRLGLLMFPFILWFGSFAVNYMIFTQKDAHTGWLVFFFVSHHAFMPLSGSMPAWLLRQIFAFFNYPLGLSWFTVYNNPSRIYQALLRMTVVPIFFSVLGTIYLLRTNRKLLFLIVITFAIVLVASAIKLYPFTERLILFLSPLAILLIAAGCESIYFKDKMGVWQTVLVALLLFGPVKNIVAQTIHPSLFGDYKKSYQREALLYLNDHYQPGDVVYVYWNDLPGYRLYKKMYDLKFTAIEGNDYRHQANSFDSYFRMVDGEVKPLLANKRVWIVQNNYIDIPIGDYIGDPAWYYQHHDGPKRFHDYIMQTGRVKDEFRPMDRDFSDIGVMLLN